MPQKLHHKKKRLIIGAQETVQTSYSFPQTKARNDKTFAADDKRHGAFKICANFAPKKAKKISGKSSEPGELQRRGQEGRKRSLRRPPRTETTPTFTARPPSCAHTKLLRRSLCPVPAIATAGTSSKGGRTGSRFPNLTASRSGPRTGSRSPNLACLSIRTWGQIRVSQTFRPFDQDLAPDSDFPNLPASRSGPWGWIQVPKHSGLLIMTSWSLAGSRFTNLLTSLDHDLGLDPGSQTLWPLDHDLGLDPDSQTFWSGHLARWKVQSRFPNLLVSRSGPQVGSRMPNHPTSLDQNLKPDRGAKSRFPNLLTSRSGPHSLSSNKEYKGFFLKEICQSRHILRTKKFWSCHI